MCIVPVYIGPRFGPQGSSRTIMGVMVGGLVCGVVGVVVRVGGRVVLRYDLHPCESLAEYTRVHAETNSRVNAEQLPSFRNPKLFLFLGISRMAWALLCSALGYFFFFCFFLLPPETHSSWSGGQR